jgi:hypothetical protein
MYYGQRETDRIIERYVADGTNCVEVGVADGTKGSNTKYFEDDGWDVLCIDPIPAHIEEAKKTRKNVVECACSNYTGIAHFTVFDIGEKNINSSLSGLTPDERLLKTHGHLINDTTIITVKVDTLTKVMRITSGNRT